MGCLLQISTSRSSPSADPNTIKVEGVLSRRSSALSGSDLPLVGVKLQVRDGVGLGQHAQAVTLLRSTTLTPAAQLSNILVQSPVQFDYTGSAEGAVSVQIGAVRIQGILLSSKNSPSFDVAPSSGASVHITLQPQVWI
jgi:hypothetical protein